MIIDCHSHIWPSLSQLGQAQSFSCLGAASSLPAKPQQHQDSCSHAQVVIVLGFTSNLLNAKIPNTFISDYVSTHSDRTIAFAGIDPTQPDCLDQLTRLQQEQHFAGLVLSPACQGFHPCDSRAMRLYQLAQQLLMPIYFLNGETLPSQAMLEFAQPAALDEVARSFPDLKLVVSHLGFPWVEQTLAILTKHPNIYADVAGLVNRPWQAYRSLSLAYEYGVIEKLLFASDFPNHSVKAVVGALYNLNKITLDSVLPAVPREQLRGIVERNSLELLGLTSPKLPSPYPISEELPSEKPQKTEVVRERDG